MQIRDFRVGLEFLCGPFWYRCTDIGSRTVAAIRLVEGDPVWYDGPPYMLQEVVLDELDLEDAWCSEEDAIRASIREADTSGHLGFPHEVVCRMTDEALDTEWVGGRRYPPGRRLLHHDRVRPDGEILHPYAARPADDREEPAWIIRLYLPFTQEWMEMGEMDFLALPLSTPDYVRTRANRAT